MTETHKQTEPHRVYTACEGCLEDRAAEIAGLTKERDALRAALEAVAENVCGLLCPSVKRGEAKWTHVSKCHAITAALAGETPKEATG